MDQRFQAIRLVTERYSQLQGLRVAYAGLLWTCFGGVLATQANVTPLELLTVFLGIVVLYLPGSRMLDRYYRSRFGRIVVPRSSTSKAWIVLALAAIAISSKLSGFYPLAGAFLVVGAESLWTAIRDWPTRWHHVVGGIAGALAAAVQFTAPPGLGPALALGCAIIGLAYIPIGLLDHRLLVSVMRRHGEQEAPDLP